MLDLFSFRCDPYKSRVGATDLDPIQSSADVKRGFLLRRGIRVSPPDLNVSDPTGTAILSVPD